MWIKAQRALENFKKKKEKKIQRHVRYSMGSQLASNTVCAQWSMKVMWADAMCVFRCASKSGCLTREQINVNWCLLKKREKSNNNNKTISLFHVQRYSPFKRQFAVHRNAHNSETLMENQPILTHSRAWRRLWHIFLLCDMHIRILSIPFIFILELKTESRNSLSFAAIFSNLFFFLLQYLRVVR